MNRSARGASDLLRPILEAKQTEIAALARRRGWWREQAEGAGEAPRGFRRALQGRSVALIGEFKRRSPSAGSLGGVAGPAETARAYEAAGAAAMSVLTDAEGFGGSLEDLRSAREACRVPMLRKDFVLDEVQVWEARVAGADAVLLIVRILDDARLRDLLQVTAGLGLDAVVEVHDEHELERALRADAAIIGVNNRDLGTFRTDLSVSLRMAPSVPADRVLVAESGIRSAADVAALAEAGADAVLVGEMLMRAGPDGVVRSGLTGQPRRAREAARAGEA